MYIAKTKKDFVKHFKQSEVWLAVKNNEKERGVRSDYPMRAEAWNNYIDALVASRQLPKHANNWVNPF